MLWVGLVVAACGWAAWRIERRWVAIGDPATAMLATIVIGLTVVTTIGQVLGAVGLLTGWAVLTAAAVVLAVGFACRKPSASSSARSSPSSSTSEPTEPVSRLDIGVLAVALAAVAAQWTAHLGDAYARGMVHADNLWYHGPFAARIVQTGGLGSLAPFGYPESRYFPLNTHVLSAMLILPTGSDVLVPIVNHLAAALALCAGWIIGRLRGVAALTTLAVLVVLSLPLVGATQPGQMYNDLAAAALVVAGIALLLAAEPDHGTDGATGIGALRADVTVVAFLAFGWSLSTKLSVAVPVAVVVVGTVVGLLRAGRWRVALSASLAFAVTGGVWFVRNLIVAGSPMPYADLRIGPVGFEQQVPTLGTSLWSTLDDPREWARYYLDSLDVSYGPLWMVVVAAGLAGAVAGVVRFHGVERIVASAALAGLLAFPLMPATGELPFVNNLRYGLVSLVLGLLVGALTLATRRRAVVAVTAVAGAVVVANLASPHRGRVPAWPDEAGWAIVGVALAAAAVTAPLWWPRITRRVEHSGVVAAAAGAAALALAAFAMPAAERSYLDGRYDGDDLEDAALYAAIPDGQRVRVDVLNSVETYPFFGDDLANDIALWNDALGDLGLDGCRGVRGWMSTGFEEGVREGFVVVGEAWLMRPVTQEERDAWFGTDPSVTVVHDDGTESVYLRVGPLDPDSCAN